MKKIETVIEVMIGGQPRPVTITRKNNKRMYLRVDENGQIKVSCGYWVGQEEILSFLYEKEAWILDMLIEQRYRKEMNQEGIDGPFLYWWGEKKYVRYELSKKNMIFVDGDILTFYLKEETDEQIQKTFRTFSAKEVLKKAEEFRWEWDARICLEHGLPYPELKVRYLKAEWGVCYLQKNQIALSSRLIHYPIEGLESVLLHEYVHLLVPDHSRRFHDIMKKLMPDYKEKERVLK